MNPNYKHRREEQTLRSWWKEYFFSLDALRSLLIMAVVLAAFTAASVVLFNLTSHTEATVYIDITALFMLAVLLVARWTTGYFWGILASGIGVVLINVVFTFPFMQLNFFLDGYPIVFVCLVTTAIVTSALSGKIKRQLNTAIVREETAQQIADFSRALIMTGGYDETLQLVLGNLNRQTARTVLFVRSPADLQAQKLHIVEGRVPFSARPSELDAIADCFLLKAETGCGLEPYPDTQFRYFPLISHDEMLGIIGVEWSGVDENLALRMRVSMDSTALALERQILEDTSKRMAMEADRESLRSNLLRSISHDLRTPLTGIIGATAAILENQEKIDPAEVVRLMKDVNYDAVWLLHMTENLLSVSRLTSDDATIDKQYEMVEEIVAEAVSRCKKRFPEAGISVEVPDEPLFVPMDGTLIMQVLINLIENGIRHGQSDVSVKVARCGDSAEFIVRDYGAGLSEAALSSLFVSMEHKKPETGRGLGIGLSLCRTIIRAHGGTITGGNHRDGGAEFRFVLPLEEEEPDEV